MKKISGLLIVAMIAFTITGAAFAGSITLTPGALSYPAEAAKSGLVTVNLQNGALSNAPPAVILNCGAGTERIDFTTTSDLPSSARVIFHLTNGTWQQTRYYLLDSVSLVTMAGSDVVTGTDITFIIGNQVIVANQTLTLSITEGVVTSPTITLASSMQTAGNNLTVSVPQCFDAVGTIQGCLANAVALISSYQQFTWDIQPQTKTIDVNSPSFRTEFLPGNGGGFHSVRAGWGLINHAYDQCYTWRISLNSQPGTATIEFTLNDPGAQLCKLDLLQIYNNGTYSFDVNGACNQATFFIPAEDDWGLHNPSIDTLRMRVTGDDVLNPDKFYAVSSLNFANDSLYSDVNRASTLIITWDINGWVGTIPYVFASSDATSDTFMKIFNNSPVPGDVTVDVTPDAGGTIFAVPIGTVEAGTVGIFWAKDIATAAGLPLNSSFGAVVVVTAPQDSVTAMVNQKRPGGVDRVVPVYTDDNELYKHY